MKRVIAVAALVVTFGAGTLLGTVVTSANTSESPIQPCASEDGSGPAPCLWDAQLRGNGQGRSFISPHGSADEDVIYLGSGALTR